ncbi:hypothetical protein BH09SUM1_BH09SUM1_29960 [soil metagenome]
MDTQPIDLNLLRIANPCPVSWNSMKGTDRERFCGLCKKNVYDTSKMKADEIRALVGGSDGEVCARLFKRQDGTLVTADCAPTRRRRAVMFAMTVIGAIMAVGASAFASTTSSTSRSARPRDTAEQFARTHEPTRTIINWIAPPPPMSMIAGGLVAMPMGKIAAPAPQPNPAPACPIK